MPRSTPRGSARVLRTALQALAPGGTVAAVAPPPPPHTVDVDVRHLLNGRRLVGVTEGDSNPQVLLPALAGLVAQGRLPLERLITRFPFERIDAAVDALRSASAVKPVLTFD